MSRRALSTELRRRPTQSRARLSRDAILQASVEILDRDGVSAFNTNAVAERAGVSVGSLYQYFPNKQAILVELVRHDNDAFVAHLRAAALDAAAKPLPLFVRALVDVAVDHQFDRAGYARILDATGEPLLADAERQAHERALLDVLATALAPRLSTDESAPSAASTLALETLGLVRGMIDTTSGIHARAPRGFAARVTDAVLVLLASSRPPSEHERTAVRQGTD